MDKELLLDDIIKEKASSENLALPKDLDMKISETISKLPDRRKDKGKSAKKAITAAAITLVAICGLSVAFPAYARNVPVVESVFQFLSDKNMIDKDYIEYSSDLNLSKTSNDVTVTINNIVYDGLYLSIGYTVENKNEMKSDPHILDKDFKINGKRTSFSSSGTGKLIDKNTYVGVDSFQVSQDYLPKEIKKTIVGGDVHIPESFIMDLNIREFSDGTKGNWDFKFKVSTDKIKGKVKVSKLAIDLSLMKRGLKVTEVIFSPLNTVLRSDEDAVLETIEANSKTDVTLEYFAYDDKGRTLQWQGSTGSGNGKKVYWQYKYKTIYEDTKSVTFIPAIKTMTYEEVPGSNTRTYEAGMKDAPLNINGTTVLSQGKLGEYRVSKMEFLKDKTLVYYECSSLLTAIYPYGLIIVDDSGKTYSLNMDRVKEQGNNKFVAEIEPLSKDKKYTLKVVDLEKQYEVRDDLKFTVEVK